MVFVVRHACVAHVESKGHQEELHRGPQQPCPLPAEPCLHIKLGARGWPSAKEQARPPHTHCMDGSSEAKNPESERQGLQCMNKALIHTHQFLHPCFTDAETEAQGRGVSWPQFHTKQVMEKPTHRQEYHAVHPKRGVSGVER